MPAGRQRSIFDSAAYGTQGFVVMCAVAETALLCELIDIFECFLKAGIRLP